MLNTGAAAAPRFNVLAIGELTVNGGPEIHAPFVMAATTWLDQMAKDSNFTVTHVETPNVLTDSLLAKYDLVLQLNFTPFRWNATAMAAFQKYIDEGKGGWVGLHHAGLYGPEVTPATEPLWTWYYKFIGQINYKNYIATFAQAKVRLEDSTHPVMKGVPANFIVTTDEWYIWDKSPRPNVRVLANVDENSYQPNSTIKMGDHPVVWTNEAYKARNLYIFIGHHPNLMQNEAYKTLLRNAIFWAAAKPAATPTLQPKNKTGAGKLDIRADKQSIFFAQDERPLSISLLNASGRLLYHADGNAVSGRIDRTQWAPGSYMIRVTTSKGLVSQWLELD